MEERWKGSGSGELGMPYGWLANAMTIIRLLCLGSDL